MFQENMDMMDFVHRKLSIRQNKALDYYDYKIKVLNRAAHSIGCDPSDLDHTMIPDMWAAGWSQFKAADELENQLTQEAVDNRV